MLSCKSENMHKRENKPSGPRGKVRLYFVIEKDSVNTDCMNQRDSLVYAVFLFFEQRGELHGNDTTGAAYVRAV